MVREKLAEPELLARSPRRPPEDNLMTLVATIAIADPDLSLREIAAQLDQMHERPPRGGRLSEGAAKRSAPLWAHETVTRPNEARLIGDVLKFRLPDIVDASVSSGSTRQTSIEVMSDRIHFYRSPPRDFMSYRIGTYNS